MKFLQTQHFMFININLHIFAQPIVIHQFCIHFASSSLSINRAYLLLPNVFLKSWGKILFSIINVMSGYLLYSILLKQSRSQSKDSTTDALYYMSFLLFNPLTIVISTRGNADCIITFTLLYSLYSLQNGNVFQSALWYGFSIHLKFYPIIYFPAFLFLLRDHNQPQHSSSLFHYLFSFLNIPCLTFLLTTLLTLLSLSLFFYSLYGYEFIHETYLYHITRTDTRHNYSFYFYLLYLFEQSSWKQALGLLLFLPQVSFSSLFLV